MNETIERFREVARQCEGDVFWTPRRTPVEAMTDVARAAEELGIDQWDVYAERGAVARLEEEVAALLGKPAAAMFPSGVMAQQAALRVHCDRAGSLRVGIPQLSHLLLHEDDGPRLLHGFRFEHLSTGRALPTVEDLDRLGDGLAAVLLELPLRDAGCLLPEWDDLTALRHEGSRARRGRARGRRPDLGEPAVLRPPARRDRRAWPTASTCPSTRGSAVWPARAWPVSEDFVAEARRWRKRMGGTLFHLTPYAVAALAGLREHLPRMGEYVAWGRALAEHLVAAGITVNPSPPHTNTFELFAEGEADAVNERAIAFMERTLIQPCGTWRPADVPGWATCEVAVHASALPREPAEVSAWLSEVAGA